MPIPLRGLFVTGTDTNVGKTTVSAALLYRFGAGGGVRYWKPIQTGIDVDDDTDTVVRLSGSSRLSVLDEGVRLPRPLSPHLSARLADVVIDLADLTRIAESQPADIRWIVEGAGGPLVPVNERDLIVDLVEALGLPALVVARSTLGTINHTLLTLEALRERSIAIAGVVMVGEPNADNRDAIASHGQVAVVGELPWLDPLTPEGVQRAAEALDEGLRTYFL